MGRALLFTCVSQMSKLRCIWLEKTQAGDVWGSLRFFTLQTCDVGKCWCYYKSCDMTLLSGKIILTERPNGSLVIGVRSVDCFFQRKSTWFRYPVYSRETQHDPGSLASGFLGLQRELPAVLARGQKRSVPLLPNTVTEVNTIFFWHYHPVCRYLTILFQDSFSF